MNANYPACLAFTLLYEGGKADDPRDPGGRTNRGVTQRTYSAWLAKRGEPARDVYALSDADLRDIYASGYWAPVGGDRLPDGVDLALFDFGVNSGPARALKAYGARTSNDAATVVRSICAARRSFLHGLASFAVFGRGWTARVAACEALGVKMAEHARIGVPVGAPAAVPVTSTLAAHGAKAAVAARQGAATASGVIVAGAATTPALATLHLPLLVIGLVASAAAMAAGLLLWKAHQARARARAYAALATP